MIIVIIIATTIIYSLLFFAFGLLKYEIITKIYAKNKNKTKQNRREI